MLQPEVYHLAIDAARRGSEAAVEMLMRLPQIDKPLTGWMFEYEFVEGLKEEPVISSRWTFKEARNIANPGTLDEKKQWLQSKLTA